MYIPYWVGNIFHGLALYNLGFILGNNRGVEKSAYAIGAVLLVYIVHYFIPSTIGFHANFSVGSYCLAFVYNVTAIILFQYVFRRYFNKYFLLTHIGKNSMVYFVCHWIIFYNLFTFFRIQAINGKWLRFAIGLVVGCVLLIICDVIFKTRRLKWMVGV